MSPVQHLRMELSRLTDVEQSFSQFGSRQNPAWSIAGREFAHLHADDLLDLRLPRAIQKALRTDPKAHFRNSTSEWLEFEFHTMGDVAHLAMLAREAWAAAREVRILTDSVKLDVFGKHMLVVRSEGTWQTYQLGSDGKRSLVDVVVPDSLTESELAQYFDDLYHEAATPRRPAVVRLS